MKIDLHVHSKASKRPSEWLLKKLGCPESFTQPMDLYHTARRKGMTAVTISDHNSIDGALEIAHLPDCFLSEEVTTYFPEDKCKLHVLAWDITERQHTDIQAIRQNVYDLIAYFRREGIHHALAHPLYSVNGKLTVEHFERALLLFTNFELNGARNGDQNAAIRVMLDNITPELIEQLADKHQLEPVGPEPWRKNVLAGSDDHSSLTIARSFTDVSSAHNIKEFFKGIAEGKAVVHGQDSVPETLAYNLYSIAYQFYGSKFNIERYVNNDLVFRFLDTFLKLPRERRTRWFATLNYLWCQTTRRRNPKNEFGILQLIRRETQQLMWDNPQYSDLLANGSTDRRNLDLKWFGFVNEISNKVLCRFADRFMENLLSANVVNVFDSLGSAAALYSVMAPYFVSYSIFSEDRRRSSQFMKHFGLSDRSRNIDLDTVRVAHFTDTFYEVNGVAGTLKKQVLAARKFNKEYTVITCDAGVRPDDEGTRNFEPIRTYRLSEYPEQKLFYPPFLEMLRYCYEQRFSHIHSATPGPLGIAALAISRILKLPIVGTYHTALPQYAEYLTNDESVGELVWKYIIWYYDQMDLILVPSRNTAHELISKGIAPEKISIFPRGVDTDLFHPAKRNGFFDNNPRCRDRFKLLYVGRVSKEKNLELLVNVYKKLVQSIGNLELVVVGNGPYCEEMQAALEGTPCTFTGYLEGDALAGVYASCDLFVFPSTTDTFGNVVLEAQASGLPVLVTDSGGPQENMIHGRTGIIVKGNDEKSLLEGLKSLLMNKERLAVMGQAAREYASGRSFHAAFNQAWELYARAGDRNRDTVAQHWKRFVGGAVGF